MDQKGAGLCVNPVKPLNRDEEREVTSVNRNGETKMPSQTSFVLTSI